MLGIRRGRKRCTIEPLHLAKPARSATHSAVEEADVVISTTELGEVVDVLLRRHPQGLIVEGVDESPVEQTRLLRSSRERRLTRAVAA